MNYDELKYMMEMIRDDIHFFTNGVKPNKHEEEALKDALSDTYWYVFGKSNWDKNGFLHLVKNTVVAEIAKIYP